MEYDFFTSNGHKREKENFLLLCYLFFNDLKSAKIDLCNEFTFLNFSIDRRELIYLYWHILKINKQLK